MLAAPQERIWGRALGRESLDTMLRDAAVKVGAILLQPAEVTELRSEDDAHICRLDDGREIAARIVIAACGSWNPKGIFAVAGDPARPSDLFAFKAHFRGSDLTPGLMTVAFVGSGKFIKERPEVAERFVLALTEAARMMQGNDYLSQENIDAYMKYTATTEDALKKATPAVYDPNMEIPVKGLADVERVHRENGRTDYDTPIDLKKVVDTQFVDKALADLGEAKN